MAVFSNRATGQLLQDILTIISEFTVARGIDAAYVVSGVGEIKETNMLSCYDPSRKKTVVKTL